MKKRRSQLLLSLPIKKAHPENDENSINFRWLDVQEEDDIVKTNFTKSWLKQTYEEIFIKRRIVWWLRYRTKENKN